MRADSTQQLQASLGDLYRIDRELGRGGMATVYLAEDTKHHRPVALKVLHPGLAASLGPERFRREIELAARLQHPHILSVHDSGETSSGQLWFTMPYVEGESLRDRLRRQRQLPLDEALRITREVALALDYAHRHGAIHRDIKPENILLVDGQAMVADFGVARALAAGKRGEALTETGMAIGTPAYMSPEQAAGEHSVEGTSDVYSLGVVLYEMLAGEPPYSGPTAQAIAAKMMAGEPPTVRRTRPSVPEAVDQAMRKALSPVPADRYATAAEFARALETGQTAALVTAQTQPHRRRIIVAGVGLGTMAVLLAAGQYLQRVRGHRIAATPPGASVTGPTRIAVLPFDNLGDSSDAYFADGLTDAVRTKLTALPVVEVIASNSSAQYRHTTKSFREIGQELGVRYLLVGKVRWAKSPGTPGRIQVTPELVDAASAADKWSAPYDTTLTDVFRVQAGIASEVAQALGVVLTSQTRRQLDAQPTQNLAAYDAYLRGEAIAARSLDDPVTANRAAAEYERAVTLDSNFALAWAGLASARSLQYQIKGQVNADEAEEARRASDRALALAPDLPRAWVARCVYDGSVLDDDARYRHDLDVGLRLAPTNADLLTSEGNEDQYLKHWNTAESHFREAQRIDPRSPTVATFLAGLYLSLGRLPDANAESDRALAIEPGNLNAIGTRVQVALAQGDLAGARSIVRGANRDIDSTALLVYLANTSDVWWALDRAQQQVLLALSPSALDGDTADLALLRAEIYWLRGDSALMRAYADSSRLALEPKLSPARPQSLGRATHALALGYLGRGHEAVQEAQWAVTLDSGGDYVQTVLARAYVRNGQPDRALDVLERLLSTPPLTTSATLRINPNYAPLRGNPRFERLLARPPAPAPAAPSADAARAGTAMRAESTAHATHSQ